MDHGWSFSIAIIHNSFASLVPFCELDNVKSFG